MSLYKEKGTTFARVRANTMRHDIIQMIEASKSGHPGGSLSVTDILATLFFTGVMHYNPDDPKDPERDRLILSKGHAAPALYAAFKEVGWVKPEELPTLRQLGTRLMGHPDSTVLDCVEVGTGSLGQGLAIASGMALGLKLTQKASGAKEVPHVWCVCGDGELQEGSNWEAMMFAAHRKLDNLTMILDLNNLQIDGHVTDVNSLGDIDAKLRSFGWHVKRVPGHSIDALYNAFNYARMHVNKPTAVVCETIKGKGVSFMEDKAAWHGTAPTHQEAMEALAELDAAFEKAHEAHEKVLEVEEGDQNA